MSCLYTPPRVYLSILSMFFGFPRLSMVYLFQRSAFVWIAFGQGLSLFPNLYTRARFVVVAFILSVVVHTAEGRELKFLVAR